MGEHALIQKQLLAIRLNSSACASPARFVGDVQDIIKAKFDEDKEAKACASAYKDGKRHLLSYVDGMFGGKFSMVDISNVPDKDLVSASSQEKTLDRVQMKLEVYKKLFAVGRIGRTAFKPFNLDDYKENFVHQGEQVVVPAEPGNIITCILAVMHSGCAGACRGGVISGHAYYDLSLYDHRSKVNINYASMQGDHAFDHSGLHIEQGLGKNIMVQFGKIKDESPKDGDKMAVFITGYEDTPLKKFSDEFSPANIMFDHKKKIVHIIEFPMDTASVGNATLGIPGAGEFRNGNLYYDVFVKPETGNGCAPRYSDQDTNKKLKAAVERFSGCKEETVNIPGKSESNMELEPEQAEEAEESTPGISETIKRLKISPHILHIEVGDVEGCGVEKSHLIKSVGGVACYLNGKLDKRVHTIPPTNLGSIVLPGLLGPIQGPFICLAAHPIEGKGMSPHDLEYFTDCFPIVTVSTAMTDTARQTVGKNRINGLFIIEPAGPVDTHEQLAEVNKNAVNALAGPLSLVLVKHGKSFRFLEGISLKGLIDEVPEFGDTVNLDMEVLEKWAMENVMEQPIVDITKCKPKIGDQSFTLQEIISFIKKQSIDDILKMKQSILCLYSQLTRIYEEEDLGKFGKELFDVLDKLLTAPPRDAREAKKLKAEFEKGNTKLKVSSRYLKEKEEYAKKKKQLKFLMDKVSSLLVTKNASSVSMSHKQLKRFNAIQSNVDSLKTMDRAEFEEKVELSCSQMGVLVSAGESRDLKAFLDTVGKNEMKKQLLLDTEQRMHTALDKSLSITNRNLLQLSSRQQMIDALTATCLLDVTSLSQNPLHSGDSSVGMSMPESNHGSRGAVLLPLMDKFVTMTNPYKGNWINLCNDPDVSMFRLLLRGTFMKATIGRELPQQINHDSRDLSWGMVNIYLDLMHQLSSHRTTPMTEENFDDTLCQQIRCLFGLILTQLASGQDPISLIWQLWRENARPDLPMQDWHWPLYLEMAYLMQFTGWDQTAFKKNLKLLIIRAMNSKIVYPMTKFLREANGKKAKKQELYGPEYENSMLEVFYPAKKSLTKNMIEILESGKIPNRAFLEEYEEIFLKFSNRRVRKKGIKTTMKEIKLMIKYGMEYKDESRQCFLKHCQSTVKKYEPRLKICRLQLKRTLNKSLTDKKAPDQDCIERLTKEMDEVSMSFEKDKNIVFGFVFKQMEKVMKILSDWSKGEQVMDVKEETVARKLLKQMYVGLHLDCWNLEGVGHNENVKMDSFKVDEPKTMDIDEELEEEDIVQKIFNHNSGNTDVRIVADIARPAAERVTTLANMIKVENAEVLVKLAGFAGFGETDEKVMENLFRVLNDIYHFWHLENHVMEKAIVDKMANYK